MPKLQLNSVLKAKRESNVKLKYDRTNKIRPSWLRLVKSKDDIRGINIKYGKWRWTYFRYLANYFLPTNYNKEDMASLYSDWSNEYDLDVRKRKQNQRAIDFTVGKLVLKIKPNKQKILDIGCGSGIGAEAFIERGFLPENITNLDFAKGLLNVAKKNPKLSKCNFVCADFLKFNSKKKYDIIFSFFSFGNGSYYTPEEVKLGIKNIKSLLNKRGFVVIHGHIDLSLFEREFETIYSGTYILNKEKNFKTTYYIGRK